MFQVLLPVNYTHAALYMTMISLDAVMSFVCHLLYFTKDKLKQEALSYLILFPEFTENNEGYRPSRVPTSNMKRAPSRRYRASVPGSRPSD